MPFCSQCGKEMPDDLNFCSNCGARLNAEAPASYQTSGPYQGTPYIENHLTKAILTTIFCCPPLGIPAIIQASSVNDKLNSGDVDGALRASEQADKLSNWAIGIAIVLPLLFWIFSLILGLIGAMSEY